MSERTLQDRVRDRAKRRGWEAVHIGKGIAAFDSRGNPVYVTAAPSGWPDLMLFKAASKHPVLAMELKRETEDPTEDQMKWLRLMTRCGIPSMVVKPSDLREGRVTSILNE